MPTSKNLNFAFIGAGSAVFTLQLVSDILKSEFISGGELRLVDIDPAALDESYSAVAALVKKTGRNFAVTRCADFRDALPGLDFIFFTFVTGGFESWKTDIAICERHGVLQSVGDTIGPGGIIRALRNVPVVVNIAREMEKVCPDAWAINYSNPEGALSLAIEKYSAIRTFGLCHGTPDTVRKIADEIYGADMSRVNYAAAGINHLTWITKLTIDGHDVYPELRARMAETGFDKKEPISYELFELFGLYPAPGDRHVGEFFPFYLRERVLAEKDYKWKGVDFDMLQRGRDSSKKLLSDVRDGSVDLADLHCGESAMSFVRALTTGETTLEMANVMNRGYIENISDGVVVEIPAFIDSFGLHPQRIGRLPGGIAAKCDALGREYSLVVEAAVTCDKKLALQAMTLDPLVSQCDYPEKLLDELLAAYAEYLPAGWKK